MLVFILLLATVFLAYSNGANDNFKGVATLFGSQTTSYRIAIAWATASTFAGSLCSIVLASNLIKSFSGKGLVPDAIANSVDFHVAIAFAAGLTVILATLIGFPISTTHALTGALVGAGLVAGFGQGSLIVNFSALQTSFLLPLLLSPLVAIPFSAAIYGAFHQFSQRMKFDQETCVCIGNTQQSVVIADTISAASYIAIAPELVVDQTTECIQRYSGVFLGFKVQQLIDAVHFLSAGVVSFARGLNDTPKMVSLILIVQILPLEINVWVIALAIAIGGWLNARRVAETMSRKVTKLNSGQGLSANVVTGVLVILASRFGLPVSTTHVSVGSIFGVGIISRTANSKMFIQILLSWILTLPIAAVLSGVVYAIAHHYG
jgi:inorganic phosphate transporter, PiT family